MTEDKDISPSKNTDGIENASQRKNVPNLFSISGLGSSLLKDLYPFAPDRIQALLKLRFDWHNIVGETLSRQSKPYNIKGKTLVISLTSERDKKNLRETKSVILNNINTRHPDMPIERIHFRVDPKRFEVNGAYKDQLPEAELSEEEHAKISSMFPDGYDPELKKILSALIAAQYLKKKAEQD